MSGPVDYGERRMAAFSLANLLREGGWSTPEEFAELALDRCNFDRVRDARDQANVARNQLMQVESDKVARIRRLEMLLREQRALVVELAANQPDVDREDWPALTAKGTRAAKGLRSKGAAWADGFRAGWSTASATGDRS